jgi:hypothetical protein
MMRTIAQSAFDSLFPPESKVESEASKLQHSQVASDEYEPDETRMTLWWKIEMLVRSKIPNDRHLDEEAKSRILSEMVYSHLESLSKRMIIKGVEATSGRGLRRDLVAFYNVVNGIYEEEKVERRAENEKAERRAEKEKAERRAEKEKAERRNPCFGLCHFCSF